MGLAKGMGPGVEFFIYLSARLIDWKGIYHYEKSNTEWKST